MNVYLSLMCFGLLLGADETIELPPELITPDRTACVWTGKEMFLWTGNPCIGAYDPEKNSWRIIKADLPKGRIVPQHFLRLSDGSVLAAYWKLGEQNQLRIDRIPPQANQWQSLATIDCKDIKYNNGKPYKVYSSSDHIRGKTCTWFVLDVVGMAAVGDDGVVFINGNRHGEPILGIRMDRQGNTKWISRNDAPYGDGNWEDTAINSFDGKVFAFTYAHVAFNLWSVWDAAKDEWSKPEECNRRYDFCHCRLGDKIYIFGGAESSAFGWIKKGGDVYSFAKNEFRPLPKANVPTGRRGGVMCSTGEKVLVWGGGFGGIAQLARNQSDAKKQPLNLVVAYDPAKQEWQTLPGIDAPPPRTHCSAVWTGKEMIIWGGADDRTNQSIEDGYAYDPKLGRWRKLPDIPTEMARAFLIQE